MKRIKKIFIPLLPILLFSSCSSNENNYISSGREYRIIIEDVDSPAPNISIDYLTIPYEERTIWELYNISFIFEDEYYSIYPNNRLVNSGQYKDKIGVMVGKGSDDNHNIFQTNIDVYKFGLYDNNRYIVGKFDFDDGYYLFRKNDRSLITSKDEYKEELEWLKENITFSTNLFYYLFDQQRYVVHFDDVKTDDIDAFITPILNEENIVLSNDYFVSGRPSVLSIFLDVKSVFEEPIIINIKPEGLIYCFMFTLEIDADLVSSFVDLIHEKYDGYLYRYNYNNGISMYEYISYQYIGL